MVKSEAATSNPKADESMIGDKTVPPPSSAIPPAPEEASEKASKEKRRKKPNKERQMVRYLEYKFFKN